MRDDVPYWSLLPAFANAAGTLVGMALVDRIGRRLLLLLSLGGVVVTLFVFGAFTVLLPPLCVDFFSFVFFFFFFTLVSAATLLVRSWPISSALLLGSARCRGPSALRSFPSKVSPVVVFLFLVYPCFDMDLLVRGMGTSISTASNWMANFLIR